MAKELLAKHSPADVLEDRINRALERILVSGKFNGSLDRLALQCLKGDITLPRHWRTMEGCKIDRDSNGSFKVRVLTNAWYEFLEGKVSLEGDQAVGKGFGMDTVRSLGDGHATMHDLPLRPGVLAQNGSDGAILCTPSDNSVEYAVTIYGTDVNFMPVQFTWEGTGVIQHPNIFNHIDRIHKDQLSISMLIQHSVLLTPETTTDLARMEPTEEETFYRRYRDDNLIPVETCNVIAYCKKRFLELTSDQDVLPITNITALGMAMDSLQYLAENDVTLSNQYQNAAIDLLNEELKDGHSVDEVPGLRFHGLLPRLRSHY
jgi:hypothetical protein